MAEIWAVLEQLDGILAEESGELLAELAELIQRLPKPATLCAVILAEPGRDRFIASAAGYTDNTINSAHDPENEDSGRDKSVPPALLDNTSGGGGRDKSVPTALHEELAASGVQHLYFLEHPLLTHYSTEGYVGALEWLLREHKPLLVAASATANGRDWTPRLAARMHLPYVSGCLGLDLHDDGLFALRSVYEGRAYIQTCTAIHSKTVLATMLPGVRGNLASPKNPTNRQLEQQLTVTHLTPDLSSPTATNHIRHIGIQTPSPEAVELDAAERIIAGGRGIGREGFTNVAAFARLLSAAVGATRVATDRGWIEHERQIGATGKNVHPKLYIACGISGAAQHTSGMREAQTVVAINPDRSAPIFALSDLGLLGDANQILPLAAKMIEQLGK
ncbi:MAG TPA: electron transfer flavoprotein subunit alpha/FixB family protein [Ktedonobacteraceae bacterium]|nr:electron transfer flavoprotein subunit alpha/FixB family protein [Ktedonobacteraceae bacterium]